MADKVGFIGLGIMGQPMAMNLLQAGFAVRCWNRTAARMEPVVAAGATAGASPADVAAQVDVTITMVSDTPDVQAVILGENGVVQGVRDGSVVIDMSTISPTATREMAAVLQERGAALLDAPVSGGDTGARQGTLSIMVGGEEAVFQRCRPIFEALGRKITYCGPSGQGQSVKLCNQVAGALNLLAVCEALIFGARQGVDLEVMLEAIGSGAAGSWMISNMAPRAIQGDFAPGFMVKLQQKDLRLVLEAADAGGLSLPATALCQQLFNAATGQGWGEEGTQSLLKVLETLNGLEARG